MTPDLDNLARRWRVAYLAPLGRALESGWTWWRGEITALLPESLRDSLATASERVFLQISEPEVVLFRGTIERMQEFGRLSLDANAAAPAMPAHARDVVLLLPPDRLLTKTLTLPAATEENLREVLGFEMDRQTPFAVDDVYYDYEITARSPAEKTIDVLLAVVPKARQDALLERLAAAGIRPDVVSARDSAGGMHDINLGADGGRRPGGRGNRLVTALAASAVVLFLAAGTIPVVQKRALIDALEPRVEGAMEQAREGTRMRESIERMVRGAEDVVRLKDSTPLLMRVIDELTRILPDTTSLTRLDVADGEIQIQGQSTEAASLIALIEASDLFENPQFRSPVTQIPRSDAERFHLSAEWRRETAP